MYEEVEQEGKNRFGLCGYEYESTTIMGKINKKTSHHLNFQKSPARPVNINKVWYSKEKLISAVDWEEKQKNITHRVHSFKSNSEHELYSTILNKDRVQNNLFIEEIEKTGIEKAEKIVRTRSDMHVLPLEKMKGREPLARKQYISELEYESVK